MHGQKSQCDFFVEAESWPQRGALHLDSTTWSIYQRDAAMVTFHEHGPAAKTLNQFGSDRMSSFPPEKIIFASRYWWYVYGTESYMKANHMFPRFCESKHELNRPKATIKDNYYIQYQAVVTTPVHTFHRTLRHRPLLYADERKSPF
jgi:hypothetical protein